MTGFPDRENPQTQRLKRERKRWFEKRSYEICGERLSSIHGGGYETPNLFTELRACYIDGHFIATVVIGASIAEQCLVTWLDDADPTGDTLGAVIDKVEEHELADEELIESLETLNETRNGYVHYRGKETKPSPNQKRSENGERPHPKWVGEEDAKDALVAVFEIARFEDKIVGDLFDDLE